MITCRECAELLLDFLNEELEAELCEHMRQHLDRCRTCVTYVETYQITIRMTRQLTCSQLPPSFAQRLWEAIQREE